MIDTTFDQAKKIITKDLDNWNSNFWRLWCREQVSVSFKINNLCKMFNLFWMRSNIPINYIKSYVWTFQKYLTPFICNKYDICIGLMDFFFEQADISGPKKLSKMWVNFRCWVKASCRLNLNTKQWNNFLLLWSEHR